MRRKRIHEEPVARRFSAVYKLTLGEMIKWIIYDLPENFTDAANARRFVETWKPNEVFINRELIPLEVCEYQQRLRMLDRRLVARKPPRSTSFGPGPHHPFRRLPCSL